MAIRPLRLRVILSGNLFLIVQIFLIIIDSLELASFQATTQDILPISDFTQIVEDLVPTFSKKEGKGKIKTTTEQPKSKAQKWRRGFNLKRRPQETKDYHRNKEDSLPLKEMDCSETYFMSPFHNPVSIALNTSIYSREDMTCSWHFIGTEPCIPMLSCDTSKLNRSCDKEYLEIVDGVGGAMKVCGGSADEAKNIQASGDLRDLYLHYKILKDKAKPLANELFNCTVVCSKRGEGTALKKTFENVKNTNPNCFCGTKPNDDRIVNGETAQKYEFPWLVTLVETNTRQPFCGGSIINNRFVQTAGHCIKGRFMDYRNIQVIVNGHVFDQNANTNTNGANGDSEPSSGITQTRTYPLAVLEQMDKANGSKRFNIEEIIVHPLYVSENNDFDVTLLKLTENIDLNFKKLDASMESIFQQPRAICLPPFGSYLRTYAGKKAVVAGWGLPGVEAEGTMQTLQKLEVNVFSPRECKEMFSHRVNRRMLCAGYKEGGKDSCSGDSGGPLVLEDRSKVWYQIGSVAFGEGCGEEQHPGVYFRTSESIQWITYQSNYHAARADETEEQSSTWCMVPP